MHSARSAKPVAKPDQVGKLRRDFEPVKKETDTMIISLAHGGSDGIDKLVRVHRHARSLDW
ncbi:hypothetical protein ACIA6C_29730 [Streptomyces sp. NPDC051578]|uniref:hypothetical protein n=1 Tax=Streptomyces sp. NPDC051578 TaxID=3365662 RepID=UPI0037BC7101